MNSEIEIIETVITVEAQARTRAGTVGDWCCMCGHKTNDLAPCGCSFPEALHCKELRRLCGQCRGAHSAVADFLAGMFREKKVSVPRVDARRSRKFRWLREALESIGEKSSNSRAAELRSALGRNACPFGDEPAEFRENVLRAFRVTKFLAFQELHRQVEEEERLFYLMKITNALRF